MFSTASFRVREITLSIETISADDILPHHDVTFHEQLILFSFSTSVLQ